MRMKMSDDTQHTAKNDQDDIYIEAKLEECAPEATTPKEFRKKFRKLLYDAKELDINPNTTNEDKISILLNYVELIKSFLLYDLSGKQLEKMQLLLEEIESKISKLQGIKEDEDDA